MPFIHGDVGQTWTRYLPLFSLYSLGQLSNAIVSPMLVPLGRFRAYAAASCLPPTVALAGGVVLAVTQSPGSAVDIIRVVAISEWSGAIFSIFLTMSRFDLGSFLEVRQRARQFYRYGIYAYPGSLLKALSQRIDRVLLVSLLTPTGLATYAIAISMRDQLSTPVTIHSLLVRNKTIDLLETKGDPMMTRRYIRREIGAWLAFVIPGSLILAALAPWAVNFLYGKTFAAAGLAGATLIFSLPAMILMTFSWCVTLSRERPALFSILTIFSTLASMAAAALGARLYNVEGAAIGNLVVTWLVGVMWLVAAELQLRAACKTAKPVLPDDPVSVA
jgi:O-antigen/teichoic acid export membrane protein